MLKRIRNYFLIKKYPFLICRNRWNGEILEDKYAFTEIDDLPMGWRKAFGKAICRDIKNVFIETGYEEFLYKYKITEIKEKYGQLRWYDAGVPKYIRNSIDQVIEHYTKISEHTCIICGKQGEIDYKEYWLSPLCEKHRKKISKKY